MNEVFTKWREAIEYAEKRRGVRDFIENRQANALVECAHEVQRLDTEIASVKADLIDVRAESLRGRCIECDNYSRDTSECHLWGGHSRAEPGNSCQWWKRVGA